MSNPKALPPITTVTEVASSSLASSSPSIQRTAPIPASGTLLSPTSQSFFEAISSKIRSRSRSSAAKHLDPGSSSFEARPPNPRKSRSRSPNTALTRAAAQNQPRPAAMPIQPSSRAVPVRMDSPTSTYTCASMKRQSSSGSERSEWEKMTYGRHSSDWLFEGWSLTGSVKKVWSRGDSTSN